MVYNTGFWIRTPSWEFFTSFKYKKRQPMRTRYDCESFCHLTNPGWYTDLSTGRMGCFQGKKLNQFEEPLPTRKIFVSAKETGADPDSESAMDRIRYEDLAFLVNYINSLKYMGSLA